VAELGQQERLQPSLLDRLTDDAPAEHQESREQRVLSLRRLRECVLRDLGWLFNTVNLTVSQSLDEVPMAEQSVINYGMPDLTGKTAAGVDLPSIERQLRAAIWNFEPRILRNSVRVKVTVDPDKMSHNAMVFEIQGELWAQPVPVQLFLKTELDLETGNINVAEYLG
jgi:type VI secretion system protein ImpF